MDQGLLQSPHSTSHHWRRFVDSITCYIPVTLGTVIGSLLFLAYINDLPECLASPLCRRLSSMSYRYVKTPQDAKALQEGLDKLQGWEKECPMEFYADKCEVPRISNKRKSHEISHTIQCHIPDRSPRKPSKSVQSCPHQHDNKKGQQHLGIRRNLHYCPVRPATTA